jgi:hypothetical protein
MTTKIMGIVELVTMTYYTKTPTTGCWLPPGDASYDAAAALTVM